MDATAVWAQSMARALAAAGCSTMLLLKARPATERLTASLEETADVTVRHPQQGRHRVDPGPRGLTPEQAVELITRIDGERHFHLVVLRGRRTAAVAAHSEALAGRLWTCLDDIPHTLAGMTPGVVAELTDVALASRFLLCPSEELRCFLESTVPAACGRAVLLPPVLAEPRRPADGGPGGRLRIGYAGSLAASRNVLEMTELPAALAARGVPAELHVVGDPARGEPPEWSRRATRALEDTPDVVWHGGRSREEALDLLASCDVALSWHRGDLDTALVPALTVLEPGLLGIPVVVNRTPLHEALFGPDYPLYADPGPDSAVDALARAADPDVRRAAGARCAAVSAPFTPERAVRTLRSLLRAALPAAPRGTNPNLPLKVAVAGPDLSGLARLVEHLDTLPGVELRVDEWEGPHTHDRYRSRELAAWADVVICEWCGPHALFYARYKRSGQRLLVRLHRFELSTEWPRRLDIEKVDAVVCVSPHYAERARQHAGWPADRVAVLPEGIDVALLSRPKLPGARYTLGMLGVTPSRKRLDRALDVLAELRRRDPRYTLAVKTRQPWDYWWVWNRPEERAHYERAYRRIQRSGSLAEAVVFDPYGPDVAVWLRRVGFVLSTSDDESFHRAAAEGAASGSVPVVWDWPGADTVYSSRWIHRSTAEMADAVHTVVTEDRFDPVRAEARAEITENYDLPRVLEEWVRLIVAGERPEPRHD
ncbi:glycosyltransferase [Thermobifida halotolerans]|uniref:Glycosyltransferase n=1 Tax=Thermobifida halotolerans TaxID=483545 RepID=A0AA97M6C5_9ACTN|nr:glycosyltransferase [Thermobifida halotolerans]UOE22076.1 glycosyltransferase [Thermobifida halotolerans]